MKKKIDWKYILACIAGGVIITGAYFLNEYSPTSAICFVIVGVICVFSMHCT